MAGKRGAAVLVDADDIPHDALRAIYSALSSGCDVRVFRVFGNFARPSRAVWTDLSAEFPLEYIMTPENTPGKSPASLALALDAMDLLFTSDIDVFCLCSAGSDFSRLARKLRGYGKEVIGVGESCSCQAFRVSCTRFLNLSELMMDNGAMSAPSTGEPCAGAASVAAGHQESVSRKRPVPDKGCSGSPDNEAAAGTGAAQSPHGTETEKSHDSEGKIPEHAVAEAPASAGTESGSKTTAAGSSGLESIVYKTFLAMSEKKDRVCLAQLVQALRKSVPGFSPKKYGFSKFKDFIGSFSFLEVQRDDVILTQPGNSSRSGRTQPQSGSGIGKFIRSVHQQLCSRQGSGNITTSDLCNALVRARPGFSSRQYGYPDFQRLLKSLGFVQVVKRKGKPPLVKFVG